MKTTRNNYAFIDSQNLNLSIRRDGWVLDMLRFRIYIKDKYDVTKAFLFLGYVEKYQEMYDFFERVGYTCIFKPTLLYKDGNTKGNVDAELVLHTMIEFKNFNKAVIVSGDGDFYCLVDYLKKQNKLEQVLIPNENCYSSFLKRTNESKHKYLSFISELRDMLEYKRKGPHKDRTL
ncbi:MAG: NYN domain-containing protein [Patescibacteria group bacterium]